MIRMPTADPTDPVDRGSSGSLLVNGLLRTIEEHFVRNSTATRASQDDRPPLDTGGDRTNSSVVTVKQSGLTNRKVLT